jgi:hypothetical protein
MRPDFRINLMNDITRDKEGYSARISPNRNNIIGITYILIGADGGYLRRGGNNCADKKKRRRSDAFSVNRARICSG